MPSPGDRLGPVFRGDAALDPPALRLWGDERARRCASLAEWLEIGETSQPYAGGGASSRISLQMLRSASLPLGYGFHFDRDLRRVVLRHVSGVVIHGQPLLVSCDGTAFDAELSYHYCSLEDFCALIHQHQSLSPSIWTHRHTTKREPSAFQDQELARALKAETLCCAPLRQAPPLGTVQSEEADDEPLLLGTETAPALAVEPRAEGESVVIPLLQHVPDQQEELAKFLETETSAEESPKPAPKEAQRPRKARPAVSKEKSVVQIAPAGKAFLLSAMLQWRTVRPTKAPQDVDWELPLKNLRIWVKLLEGGSWPQLSFRSTQGSGITATFGADRRCTLQGEQTVRSEAINTTECCFQLRVFGTGKCEFSLGGWRGSQGCEQITARRRRRFLLATVEPTGRLMARALSEVIDDLGVGWYHALVVLFCSGLMLADGAEMLMVSSIVGALDGDLEAGKITRGLLVSTSFLGMLLGNLLSGSVSGRYGRWCACMTSTVLLSFFGLLCSVIETMFQLFLTQFCLGLAIGVGGPASVTLLTETAPTRSRGTVSNSASFAFTLGEAWTAFGLLLFMPELKGPWRLLCIWGVLPALLVAPFGLLVHESPSWLQLHERHHELRALLASIRRMHGKDEVDILVQPMLSTSSSGTFKILIQGEHCRTIGLGCTLAFVMNYLFFGTTFDFRGGRGRLDISIHGDAGGGSCRARRDLLGLVFAVAPKDRPHRSPAAPLRLQRDLQHLPDLRGLRPLWDRGPSGLRPQGNGERHVSSALPLRVRGAAGGAAGQRRGLLHEPGPCGLRGGSRALRGRQPHGPQRRPFHRQHGDSFCSRLCCGQPSGGGNLWQTSGHALPGDDKLRERSQEGSKVKELADAARRLSGAALQPQVDAVDRTDVVGPQPGRKMTRRSSKAK
ncbi:unnamed protein product [Effrenium voratum]|nr:unnamed protein product [Effrenium voratum]